MITNITEKSDRSISPTSDLNTHIKRYEGDIESLRRRLAEMSLVKFYTSEIKKEKAKIESDIIYKTKVIAEIEEMQKFPPGSWVKNGSNTPGKVIELRVIGSVSEVQVQWWGSTVPIPERPHKLTLVDDFQLEYVWNGDRFPKLVRRIDRHECDEIDVLQNLSTKLAVDKRVAVANDEPRAGADAGASRRCVATSADSSPRQPSAGESPEAIEVIEEYRREQIYLKKRIAWVNAQDLERLERTVRQGLEIFYRVGEALAEIRDRKLYKDLGYSNFRDYLRSRWNMKKSRAYQLIDSAEVVKNLSTSKSVHNCGQNEPIAYQSTEESSETVIPQSDIAKNISELKSVHNCGQNESIAYQSTEESLETVIPKTEGVAREVGKVPLEKQAEVWRETVERFGKNPTAKQVKEVVAEVTNCPDSQSTVQISRLHAAQAFACGKLPTQNATYSCPDKEVTGNQKLAELFKIGQLVKLQLSSFDGVSEDLKLVNHSYGQIISLTETKCSFKIKIFGHKLFVVSPQDLKPVDSVRCCVEFSAEQFITLMSEHQTKDILENAMKKGVI